MNRFTYSYLSYRRMNEDFGAKTKRRRKFPMKVRISAVHSGRNETNFLCSIQNGKCFIFANIDIDTQWHMQ